MAGIEQVRIVLVGPLYGGNVGSVCRAMANMGLSELVVVDPQFENMEEARKMACHARPVLENRRTVSTLEEAVADCALVAGTSAKEGLYRQHAMTPRALAPVVLESTARGPAALVFGREDNGLSNEEMALCTRIIKIPTSPECSSLNLSQAVLLCCYELFLLGGGYEAPVEKSPPATGELRERMFAIWRELLLEIGFMEEDKADHMMQGFRRVMGRGAESSDDVRIMMGVARQMEWAASHARKHKEKS